MSRASRWFPLDNHEDTPRYLRQQQQEPPTSPILCSAEEAFSLSSSLEHAPWKMHSHHHDDRGSSSTNDPKDSSYLTNYRWRQRRQYEKQQEEPSSPISSTSSSSGSSTRRSVVKQRSRSSGRPRRRGGRNNRISHRRSPSDTDTTALTEASSSEDYDYNNNNTTSSSGLYPYRYDLGELERAIWLVGENNADAQQQQDQDQQSQSLLDTEPVEELTILTGRNSHPIVPTRIMETSSLHDQEQKEASPTAGVISEEVGGDLAASFDFCSPTLQRYQKRNNNVTTPPAVYLRYREHVKHDSPPSKIKQDSSPKVLTSSPSKKTHPPVTDPTLTASTPTEPKALSNYKQHILKKHSSFEKKQKQVGADKAKEETTTRPTSSLERPTMARAKSTTSSLATVRITNTTTTPATARAMAKLTAARRAKSHGSVADTTTTTTTTTTSTSASRDLINEIVSPSKSIGVGHQYIDSDDLLAVEAMSAVSMHHKRSRSSGVASIASNTPTVRAGCSPSSSDRNKSSSNNNNNNNIIIKSTIGLPRRRVLSPLPPMCDDECDMSMASSMAALSMASMASNPVSIDECGPIDVDTGKEIDALIDSIAVVSPLYDEDTHRLNEKELRESLYEEERFRGVEFPVCDEVEMTRGLMSYMRGFEPRMEEEVRVRNSDKDVNIDVSMWYRDAERRDLEREMNLVAKNQVANKRCTALGMNMRPKLLSLMCGVPQYQAHNNSIDKAEIDIYRRQQQQARQRREQQLDQSDSTSTGLQFSDQNSRVTFEI